MSADKETTDDKRAALLALKQARELVFNGWVKGSYTRLIYGIPCYCLTGAVLYSIPGMVARLELNRPPLPRAREVQTIAYDYLYQQIREDEKGRGLILAFQKYFASTGELLVDFNDAEETEKADVIRIVDNAIEQLETELNGEKQCDKIRHESEPQ